MLKGEEIKGPIYYTKSKLFLLCYDNADFKNECESKTRNSVVRDKIVCENIYMYILDYHSPWTG